MAFIIGNIVGGNCQVTFCDFIFSILDCRREMLRGVHDKSEVVVSWYAEAISCSESVLDNTVIGCLILLCLNNVSQ